MVAETQIIWESLTAQFNEKNSLKIQYSTNEFLAAKFEKWAHIWCQLITKSDLTAGISFITCHDYHYASGQSNIFVCKVNDLYLFDI